MKGYMKECITINDFQFLDTHTDEVTSREDSCIDWIQEGTVSLSEYNRMNARSRKKFNKTFIGMISGIPQRAVLFCKKDIV